ncbi:coatomer subunit beta [Achlya hypogyna]|uniref:Coatomer subunit beta n=1 Tax=Achlya hypogyna TaxID=1202772 RepID=A0A1V9ZL56_ACHHY|nr:coatomer subunit beta [Achlya hypogyna]
MSTTEKNCTVLLFSGVEKGGLQPPSQDEILKGLESAKMEDKVRALKAAILALLNGEKLPRVLMQIIRFCSTKEDHQLKKLLMIYWEIASKYDEAGKLLPEMILVCNALLNDLNHANEYIRGSMLRFLCKIKERELLEPLKDAVKANLDHRHAYVRKNAVMAVYSMFKNFGELLIPDAPELIERFIVNESDASARRNAFMMLFDCAENVAVNFLMNSMDQIPKFGDGFSLVILELTRKVCRADPAQKARFVRCIFQLLQSSSAAVSYEAAWTLVTLSSAPTAVRAAAKTYAGLLNSQSDNNVKLIVLDRLADLKKHHTKILQEVLMDVMRALSSPNLDICKKVLEIAMSLVSPRNIEEVVGHLKREILKTQEKGRMEKAQCDEYRALLIKSINACAVKFPDIAHQVVHLLLEFVGSDGAMDVLLFVRTMCESYPELRPSILQKLLISFTDIQSAKVYRVALWVLGEYASDDLGASDTAIDGVFATIVAALGPLPLTAAAAPEAAKLDPVAAQVKPTTKSIVLADGTYATETSYSAPAVVDAAGPVLLLRKLILNGDFFLASTLAATLTKLVARAIAKDPAAAAEGPVKAMTLDALRYIVAIVVYGLDHCRAGKGGKAELDEDSRRRMLLCVRILSEPAAFEALHGVLIRDCRAAYQAVLEGAKAAAAAEQAKVASDEPALLQADDLISFRQLRGKKALGSTDIDIDDGADIGRAVASNEYSGKLRAVHQLTGFADSVYAEAYVTVHDYDIVLEILVINRTPATLNNLSVDLTPMGDLKLIERPASVTIGPLDTRTIRANIKVSSTETGHIFGTIVYESASGADKTYVNLNDIHLDIMDYIVPATCADTAFRSMWAEFEWENKVAVNTDIANVFAFLQHIVDKTNMRCMTPTASLGGDTNFLAANLYAKSIFGEDALANLSVEKLEKGKITGHIRIRSKTQGIALSLGDRITAVQRGHDDPNKRKKVLG